MARMFSRGNQQFVLAIAVWCLLVLHVATGTDTFSGLAQELARMGFYMVCLALIVWLLDLWSHRERKPK